MTTGRINQIAFDTIGQQISDQCDCETRGLDKSKSTGLPSANRNTTRLPRDTSPPGPTQYNTILLERSVCKKEADGRVSRKYSRLPTNAGPRDRCQPGRNGTRYQMQTHGRYADGGDNARPPVERPYWTGRSPFVTCWLKANISPSDT